MISKFIGNSLLKYLGKSQLFVALCAFFLCAESYKIIGVPYDVFVLVTVLSATLFVYNAARLNLSFNENKAESRLSITLNGNREHVILCIISFIGVFACLSMCNPHQILMFLIGSLLSLIYLMPFSRNGKKVKGLRNNPVLKNILLSFIWAVAIVLFPFAGKEVILFNHEIVYLFLRHFFFVYALTVVYDMRDLYNDRKAGMKTLALILGETGTRIFALLMICVFMLFIYLDPSLKRPGMEPVSQALYFSAFITAMIIFFAAGKRSRHYYLYAVDGTMILQYFLVLGFLSL